MTRDIIIIDEHGTRNVRGVTGITVQEFEDILRAYVVSVAKYNDKDVLDLVKLSILSLQELQGEILKKESKED